MLPIRRKARVAIPFDGGLRDISQPGRCYPERLTNSCMLGMHEDHFDRCPEMSLRSTPSSMPSCSHLIHKPLIFWPEPLSSRAETFPGLGGALGEDWLLPGLGTIPMNLRQIRLDPPWRLSKSRSEAHEANRFIWLFSLDIRNVVFYTEPNYIHIDES